MNKILNSPHFKYGLPFIIVVVGGSFGLQIYSQIRYDVQAENRIVAKTDALKALAGNKKPITLEEAYEEYKKEVDLDNWKNIRGPRPWENDNTEFKEVIERRAAESKNRWVFK